MLLYVCSESAHRRLREAGVIDRIQVEILTAPLARRISTNVSNAREVVSLGHKVLRTLDTSFQEDFPSHRAFKQAVGAAFLEEYAAKNRYSLWRTQNHLTRVSNFGGEEAYFSQIETNVPGINIISTDEERQIMPNYSFWPFMLATSLLFFDESQPNKLEDFFEGNFVEWSNKTERRLYGECLTDEELGAQPKKGCREKAPIDHGLLRNVKDLFSQGLPDATSNPQTLIHNDFLVSDNHTVYGLYKKEGNLVWGVVREYLSPHLSRPLSSTPSAQTIVGGQSRNLYDWMRFSQREAPALLNACFAQYTRDRTEVTPIVNYFLTRHWDSQFSEAKPAQ